MEQTGVVKWWNEKKGYGFITRDEGLDVFAHYSDIDAKGYRSLSEGQRVSFVIEEGPKGPIAKGIQALGNV